MPSNAATAAVRDRRAGAAAGWAASRGAVLIPAGLPVPIRGTDQSHEFHAHPEHYYLAGTAVPGSVLAFDPGDGWVLFAPVASREERVWVGDGVPLAELASRSGVDRVLPRDQLRSWLERRRAEPLAVIGNHDLLERPGDYGLEGFESLELELDPELSARLSEQVSELRRTKDPWELDLMRSAAEASRSGHAAALRLARHGQSERELQVEIEAHFFRAGAERTAYGSIVGSGLNGSILHIAPSSRQLRAGDIVMVDAGAEWQGYASDVSRTFPVDGRFEGPQRDLYQLVFRTQARAIAGVQPGVEYKELHLAAALDIASGLADLGILRGAPQSLVERDAHAVFFPHGLGHMLGLATHDAGGCLAGRAASDRFGLKWLRADLPLAPGYVVTVEPGIYFIHALLEDPEIRGQHRDDINWERVDRLLDFGGIRIEDDVLVTEYGCEVLTAAIPKAIDEVEAARQEALGV
jgi:Xaa-Pro aminopeptidase